MLGSIWDRIVNDSVMTASLLLAIVGVVAYFVDLDPALLIPLLVLFGAFVNWVARSQVYSQSTWTEALEANGVDPETVPQTIRHRGDRASSVADPPRSDDDRGAFDPRACTRKVDAETREAATERSAAFGLAAAQPWTDTAEADPGG